MEISEVQDYSMLSPESASKDKATLLGNLVSPVRGENFMQMMRIESPQE